MDFNQVRYFLALADTLNFTRAAEKCYVSQPSLTQAIKRLEDELGGELIRRDGRYTELTELGKSLRGHFEQINRTRHLVRSTAQAITSGEVAELNVGVMCTVGPRVLAGMLDAFRMEHPSVSIVLHDVTPQVIPRLLLSGAIDGAFCARHDSVNDQLRYIDLFEEPLVIAFPADHEFANKENIPLDEIANQQYVDRLHCEFRDEIIDAFEEKDLEFDVVFRSEREDWIQSLVRDGMGITCVPRYSLLEPELDHRPIVEPKLIRTVELAIVEQDEIPPALDLLIQHAKRYEFPSSD